jgi:site-specific recombinase XerD
MSENRSFRRHPWLEELGSESYDHLVAYLTFLHLRQSSPDYIRVVQSALKMFCCRLPKARRTQIMQDWAHLSPEDIETFLQAAYDAGLAASTIRTRLNTARRFFEFLQEEGRLAHHPFRRNRHVIHVPQPLPRYMPEADLVRFFQVIDRLRDRLLFLLMLRCGLRVSEARTLKWDAIRWDQEAIRVDDSKGHVDRVVYYTPDLEQALSQWWQQAPSDISYLFPSPEKGCAGQPLTDSQIRRLMTTYLRRAEITALYTPHSLRHTFATVLLNAGASLEVVKELMGHRHLDMTLRYARLYDSTRRQQYDQAMNQVTQRQQLGGAQG